jgi:hypothetical protein
MTEKSRERAWAYANNKFGAIALTVAKLDKRASVVHDDRPRAPERPAYTAATLAASKWGQAACLSCTWLVCVYPCGWPQAACT